MGRNRRPKGERCQNNVTIPQDASTQDQSQTGNALGPNHQVQADPIQQVDSWRSYKSDRVNLQSSITPNSYIPLGSSNANYKPLGQSGLNVRAPAFTPYQPLRASYGIRERQFNHQAQQPPPTTTSRSPLRSRQPGNYARNSLSVDLAIPSIEKGHTSYLTSTNLVPSSLPPRLSDRRHYSRTPDKVIPPTRPRTTANYMRNATQTPATISSPKKLLVILDLNGTLLVRSKWSPTSFKLRPGVTHLLDYLFANHVVMVYSSARPQNVDTIIRKLFHPKQRAQMAAQWARDKLDLNKVQYDAKVQVYKKLDKIWADKTIQASAEPGQKWDQTNTVLVDDSYLKAAAQPHNLVQVPEFENNAPKEIGEALRAWQLQEEAILKSLEQKLEELKYQVDVSRLIREWQTGKRTAPGVVDETVDQKTHQSIEGQQPRSISPTPSLNHADSTTPQSSQSTYPSSESPLPSSTNSGPTTVDEASALDFLDAEISQALKSTSLNESTDRRSESPIDESVFVELLGRGGTNQPGEKS